MNEVIIIILVLIVVVLSWSHGVMIGGRKKESSQLSKDCPLHGCDFYNAHKFSSEKECKAHISHLIVEANDKDND